MKQLVRAHAGAAKRLASRGPLLTDLAGLPPAQLVVGRLDPLLDDSQRVAGRLKEAAVPSEPTIYDGINQGFIRYSRLIATARRAIADCAVALGGALEAR